LFVVAILFLILSKELSIVHILEFIALSLSVLLYISVVVAVRCAIWSYRFRTHGGGDTDVCCGSPVDISPADGIPVNEDNEGGCCDCCGRNVHEGLVIGPVVNVLTGRFMCGVFTCGNLVKRWVGPLFCVVAAIVVIVGDLRLADCFPGLPFRMLFFFHRNTP
jgi:hypothetical protein